MRFCRNFFVKVDVLVIDRTFIKRHLILLLEPLQIDFSLRGIDSYINGFKFVVHGRNFSRALMQQFALMKEVLSAVY